MSIERTGLDIIIRTPADTSGVEKTTGAIKDLHKATDTAEGSQDKLKRGARSTASSLDPLVKKKEQWRDVLQELQKAVPGLGEAVLLLKNPIAIGVGAIGTIIAALRSYITSVNELAATSSIHEAVSKSMSLIGGAARDAAAGMREFNDALADNAAKGKDAIKHLGEIEEALKTADRREAEKRDAREGLALAHIDAREKTKKITPEEAVEQRLATKTFYAEKRESDRQKKEAEQIEAKGEALRKLQEARLRAEEQLPGAEMEAATAARLAGTAPTKQASDIAEIKRLRTEAEAERNELQQQRSMYEPAFPELEGKNAGPVGNAFGKLLRRFQRGPIGDDAARAEFAGIDTKLDANAAKLKNLDEMEAMANAAPGTAQKRAEKATGRAANLKTFIQGARNSEGDIFTGIVQGRANAEAETSHRRGVLNDQSEARGVTERAPIEAKKMEMEQGWEQLQQAMEEYDGSNRKGMSKFDELLKRLTTRNFEQR